MHGFMRDALPATAYWQGSGETLDNWARQCILGYGLTRA